MNFYLYNHSHEVYYDYLYPVCITLVQADVAIYIKAECKLFTK